MSCDDIQDALNPQATFIHLHPIVLEPFTSEIAIQLFSCIEFVWEDSLGEEEEHGIWPLLRPGGVFELVEEVVKSAKGQFPSIFCQREEGTFREHGNTTDVCDPGPERSRPWQGRPKTYVRAHPAYAG